MFKRISFILTVALVVNFFAMVAPARAVWTKTPDVVGMTEAEAVSKINSTPYHTVGDISYEFSEDVDNGCVISQDPRRRNMD